MTWPAARAVSWIGGAVIALLVTRVKGADFEGEMAGQYNTDTTGGGLNEGMNFKQALLHRHKRDLNWDSVEEFYDDKNNFAMYLVLPIIVLVYGGCAVIYCIARCRRFMKQKKRKSKQKERILEDDEEPSDITGSDGVRTQPTSVPGRTVNQNPMPTARDGAHSSSEVRISMERDAQSDTPLPWQVPGDKEPLYNSKPALATEYASKQPNTFTNKSFSPDGVNRKAPPPAYDDMSPRPLSKPPPYEENHNPQRRESVEEIIALDPMPIALPIHEMNDRKRRRPGSRTGMKHDPERLGDMERDKARQVVRGDRPKRDPAPEAVGNRDKTPDIISHAKTRTQPLEPSYKPTMNNAQPDPSLMARQAAQLLRLDHIGKQAGKKPKRLVFVTE